MALPTTFWNRVITAAGRRAAQRFQAATHQVEAAQRRQLSELLSALAESRFSREHGLSPGLSYAEFCRRLTPSAYADWEPRILQQMAKGTNELSPACKRYQPTSGSTSASKWIPYSPKLLAEFDAAVAPWLDAAAKTTPSLQHGRQYWSLSWLPNELRRAGKSTNDQDLLPWWKSMPMAAVAAVPPSVSTAATCDDAMFATAAYLAQARDLSLLSVWSPTFALTLLSIITANKDELSEALASGSWGRRAAALGAVPCPRSHQAAALLRRSESVLNAEFTAELWPKLAFVSAWDSAASKPWAAELRALLPHAHFQAKGLWATEGVVTIPVGSHWPVALTSHFYEFRDLATGAIVPTWELELGMEVQPLLSTGSGLWRYQLQDRLAVTGFLNACPSLEFRGRLAGTDMVGEKLDSVAVQALLDRLNLSVNGRPSKLSGDVSGRQAAAQVGLPEQRCLCLVADQSAGSMPRYTLLVTSKQATATTNTTASATPVSHGAANTDELAAAVEAALCENFHYRLARQLGQLAPASVLQSSDAVALYLDLRRRSGLVAGDIKIEPLLAINLRAALAGLDHPQSTRTL